MSRRVKDANQIFEDRCREFDEEMQDLGEGQPDSLIRQNAQMLKDCQLFSNGGNYAEAEVAWYRGQMDDIDKIIDECKDKRLEQKEHINNEIALLQKDPTHEFKLAYADSI